MDEVYAWVDEQRERNSQAFYRLLEQGRSKWTPRDVFNRCCVKWLVDGNVRYDEYAGLFDQYSPRNGCNGRCNRDHPCITLRFDADAKSTVATLSHRLDPFVRCMMGLVAEGKAWPHSATEYRIDGYLRANETVLRSHDGFGRHLVKVATGEREASDAAQATELEERERRGRAAKRPRIDEGGGGTALDAGDFAKAMDVAVKQRLRLDLQDDPLTLYSMRQVCKAFKKIATSIASEKLKALDLTITPLVDGRQRFGDGKLDGYDTETSEHDGVGDYVAEYKKKEKVSLAFHRHLDARDGGYQPVNADAATFSWDSGRLNRDATEEDEYFEEDYAETAYCGQILRVYYHPSQADPIQSPARVSTYGEAEPTLGCCIARFSLQQPRSTGTVTKSRKRVSIRYEVLECDTLETEDVEEEEEVTDYYETDEEAGDGYRRVVKIVKHMQKNIQYSGRIKLLELKVDFGVLVRLHARKVNSDLQLKYDVLLRERPLTRAEKEYQKLVVAAAK